MKKILSFFGLARLRDLKRSDKEIEQLSELVELLIKAMFGKPTPPADDEKKCVQSTPTVEKPKRGRPKKNK